MPITKLSCPRRSQGKGAMRARICHALKLSPGRLPRQTRKLPTTAPQMKRPTRRTRMLNAQARSVRGHAFGVSNRQWRCRSARRRYPRQPRMSMLPGKGLFALHVGKERDSCLLEKAPDKGPRIRLNLFQMVLAAKALSVDLINGLRSRWPRGKPTIFGDYLDPADWFVVTGSSGQFRFNWLASQLFRTSRTITATIPRAGGV